ncbi:MULTISPECIES: biopolymer transporter ExbD [unclassified Oleiphilus]|uniref:ExbD/TolR family protein n=1 Tax=unclassified Oleiphilus TaxID=2631174 RepID=UPI0007C26707|nr:MULTISPECIES: biopolymer transporter ExbD [unclassified Oleiphilus]KZY46488.1 RNA polymerase subunit sigma-70 [Oleiphilus sp. HI0050]KZY79533.1 RNA polymerase subunit sigma-70 [Oleiphilus sp. HI0069]KZY80032.1 RNA polymerase subunit sigma-70 [Oleiphilus sp. HI0068]KZY88894.1 RNA polymerase subunit sigma-70 [Oleiphilus sp. HI0072]KZZ11622.1 RNA polymerase subunit sigma-70 [Oleiphilus sp. HI0078]KZZ30787.1 RNA polymerase subunit sigma-70 [Oleiphilus sp. HI0085]
MKLSRRAKRMQRHYRRMHKTGGLNLVSLMDIFTILVFFLMVNSSDVKVLQQDKSVELPLSVAKQQPKENIVIAVSGSNILVQGRVVSSISEVSDDGLFPGLKSELDYQASKNQSLQNVRDGYPVTLIADKNVPYKLLKKIMATCTAASYTRVSLAVSRKLEGKG